MRTAASVLFPRRGLASSGVSTRTLASLVEWSVEDKIGTLTLQSPQTYNALTMELGREFQRVIRSSIKDDTSLRAVVLRGEGPAFSAGGNVSWLESLRHNTIHRNRDLMLEFYGFFTSLHEIPVPVIAALHGPAVGAGACLAMACDLRVAQTNAKCLGFTFSKLGIHAGLGGVHWLRNCPQRNEILLTGKTLMAEEALACGLVDRVVDDAQRGAYDLAAEVAIQHPVAIRTMVQTLRSQGDLRGALERDAAMQAICYAREDWGEGLEAAMEKRDPVFDDYDAK